MVKFLAIIVLGMALALAAIPFVPGEWSGIMNLGNRAWGKDLAAELKNPSLPKNAAEKKILSVLDEIKRGPWMANVATLHGRLLRILTEAVNAKNVVEIGTSNGYSGLWICLGLQTTGGRLITHEIDPQTASLARANFQRAGVEHMVTLVLGMPTKRLPGCKGLSIYSLSMRTKPGTWTISTSCCPWSVREV